jgi:hypothetical protein
MDSRADQGDTLSDQLDNFIVQADSKMNLGSAFFCCPRDGKNSQNQTMTKWKQLV